MSPRITAATLACLLTAAGVVVASPASAASKIQITYARFDSAGSDKPVSNAKLNDEWIQIKNTDSVKRKITNWTLRDTANHVYRFPATTIAPGKSIRVHTGKGTDTAVHKYMNRGYYVWNNDKDTASLRNTSGGGGDTCAWTSKSAPQKKC